MRQGQELRTSSWYGTSYADSAARWRVRLHFLLAAVVLVLARPTSRLLAVGTVVIVLGLAVRAWAAGHLRKDQPLTVSGPYAHLRHPLYFGSALILVGFAMACGQLWLAALIAAYFILFFIPVMQREERERRALSPAGYAEYAAKVPAFLPRLRPARPTAAADATARFTLQLYLHNREWRAPLGCLVILLGLCARMLWG